MLRHSIIILALTLNLATNHLHALDPELYTYTESPAEPELIHNGDGEIHLYFLPQDSIRANLETTQQQFVWTADEDGWLTYGSGAANSSSNASKESHFAQKLQPHQHNQPSFLKDGMWGTGDYQLPEYHGDSNQLIPLTKEMVMTPFFAILEKASLEERTALFTRISQLKLSGSKAHITRRYNMMALIFSGPVDIPATQKQATLDWHDPLWLAAHLSDEYLLQQLLTNGATVINDRFPDRTPLHEARTTSIAHLLIKAGSNPANIKGLLHRSMDKSRPVGLVAEYLAMGCDPMERVEWIGETPLARLITYSAHAEMVKKAELLLAQLPAHKIRTLLKNIDNQPGNPFLRITQQKKEPLGTYDDNGKKLAHAQLKALFTFLMKVWEDAGLSAEIFEDCPLCLSMLCKQAMRTTLCGHTFHAQCIGSLPTCPICRASLMTPTLEQQQKNKMLLETHIHTYGNTARQRQEWRDCIIKALRLGADIRSVQKEITNEGWWNVDLLKAATDIGDCKLMQHMIECGADIHEHGNSDRLPIHYAHNLPEAELLVSYGALNHPAVHPCLLISLGNEKYKPELITYYRNLGIKPPDQYNIRYVPLLVYFVRNSSADTIDRIQRLLKGLSPEEVSALITMQDEWRKTVFDCIAQEKKDCKGNQDKINRFDTIEQYLRAVEKDPSLPSKEEISCDTISCL